MLLCVNPNSTCALLLGQLLHGETICVKFISPLLLFYSYLLCPCMGKWGSEITQERFWM